MKCTVEKSKLLEHLQKVCNVVDRKTAMPILNNLYVEAKDDTLTLTATNLEIRITTTLRAKVEIEGITTIPSKSLLALVSKLKDKEIEFESNEQFHTSIKCGNSDFFLLGIDPKEFPELFEFEPEQKVCVQQSDLVKMIDAVSYACSYDDSRKILKGICFTGKDGVFAAAATDSKRLAVIEKTPEEMPEEFFNFVMPLKTAIETKRLLGSDGTVTLELNSKMIRIDLGNTVLISKLLEGSYPNYQNIIPASFKNEVVLQKKEMIESLDLVGIPLTEANGSVTLKFGSEEMELFAQSTAVGEGRDKLMLPYRGEPFQVVFNLSYLLAPFKYFHGDALTMKINDPTSPVMLTNGDFLYIVMPIRAK